MPKQLYQGTGKHDIAIEIDLTQIKRIEVKIHMWSVPDHLTLPKHVTQNQEISKEPSKDFHPKFLRAQISTEPQKLISNRVFTSTNNPWLRSIDPCFSYRSESIEIQ